MQINDTVSVVHAHCRNTVSNSMSVASSCVTIERATEKAIKLRGKTDNGKVVTSWFPKKAFRQIGDAHDIPGTEDSKHFVVELMPWFKGDEWTGRFLSLTTELS